MDTELLDYLISYNDRIQKLEQTLENISVQRICRKNESLEKPKSQCEPIKMFASFESGGNYINPNGGITVVENKKY